MNNINSEPSTSLKLMAALSYISYFFLPVIFPLIVWIVASDRPFVKKHAKRAFWSQLLPAICALVFLIVISVNYFVGMVKYYFNCCYLFNCLN